MSRGTGPRLGQDGFDALGGGAIVDAAGWELVGAALADVHGDWTQTADAFAAMAQRAFRTRRSLEVLAQP